MNIWKHNTAHFKKYSVNPKINSKMRKICVISKNEFGLKDQKYECDKFYDRIRHNVKDNIDRNI